MVFHPSEMIFYDDDRNDFNEDEKKIAKLLLTNQSQYDREFQKTSHQNI